MNAKRIVSALGGALLLSASFAVFAQNNGPAAQDAPVGSLNTSQGSPLCRAAINSDGSIAGGGGVLTSAANLGAGVYEVIFKGRCTSITSANGWTHWIQVHTLTTGSIGGGVSCAAADRAGQPNGVFVNCTNAAGAGQNTSFFIKVEK
jgi:hypothetical protein